MRNRSLTTLDYVQPTYGELVTNTRTNPDYAMFNSVSNLTIDLGDVIDYPQMVSNINDVSGSNQEVFVDPKTGTWRRVSRKKRPRLEPLNWDPQKGFIGLRAEELKPQHACEHQKTVISLESDIVASYEALRDPGNPVYERAYARTATYANGGQFVYGEFGPAAFDAFFNTPQTDWTASGYLNHDWFAIADSFNEACDQFVNSKFLIGEDLVEHDIFVDAFKLVLNPTRAIRYLLNGIRRNVNLKKHRNMSLGQATRVLAKNVSNATLFYNFALKPAIHDIQDLFSAHSRVSKRMDILYRNAGRYIPVRVKDELSSPISNSLLETATYMDLKWHANYKKSTAIMGAWARVREDLTFASTWSAYLQYFGINKVAGLAWELIPCSFMIDWVFGAQKYVNKLRFRTETPYNEFRSLWYSTKQETSETLHCVPGYNLTYQANITSPSGSFGLATRKTSNYLRYPGLPKTTESKLDFSTLGFFHAITTGSIIIQRLLK